MLDFLNSAYNFLFIVAAVIVGELIMKMIEDAADKHVSFFQTINNPRLYELSFLYPLARDMKLKGMSDDEIIEELKNRFDSKRLSFQQYEPTKDKYREAVEFAGRVIHNKEAMKRFIITSDFGKKSYKKLVKELPEMEARQKEEESRAESENKAAIKCTNVIKDCISGLFIFPENDSEGQMHKDKIKNFIAVRLACLKVNLLVDGEYSELFNEELSEVQFLNRLKDLQKEFPDMKLPESTGNTGTYKARVQDNQQWITSIVKRIQSMFAFADTSDDSDSANKE